MNSYPGKQVRAQNKNFSSCFADGLNQGPVLRKMIKVNPQIKQNFEARFSPLRTCKSSFQITVESLL